MNYLVIVESPSKCKKIHYLLQNISPKDTFKVMASCGHFREVKTIDVDTLQIEFQFIRDKTKYFRNIQKYVKQNPTTELLLAADNDREGEAIAWHVCVALKKSVTMTKRLRFNEISYHALSHSFLHPSQIDMNLVEAQFTRQILDRWIGFTFSPLVSKHLDKKFLSAGRCQTPTLKLLLDNEMERETASGDTEFHCEAVFDNISFHLAHVFLDKKKAVGFFKKNQTFLHCLVDNPKTTTIYRYPPTPLTTSKLQQFCANCWKWTPAYTMQRAQRLYEQGNITYHRTDNTSFSAEFEKKAKDHISTEYGEQYFKGGRCFNKNKKNGAHEAIRPTCLSNTSMDDVLYQYIYKISIQSLMEKATLSDTLVQITSPLPEVHFEKHFSTYEFYGFHIVDQKDKKQTEYKIPTSLSSFDSISLFEKLQTYIPYLNEAQIISNLEKKGIGRPSTYASFVAKIQQRKYAEKDDVVQQSKTKLLTMTYFTKTKKTDKTITNSENHEYQKLILSTLGKQVTEFLYKSYHQFFDYDYTKEIENSLDEIAQGERTKNSVLQPIRSKLSGISTFS